MADAPGNTLDQDLNCLNCGYNLRGLPEDGQCPECGTKVFFSVIGLLITDALYLMYLAKLVRHLPGNLADWGYATAGRFVLVFLAGCLLPSVSRSGPPVLELSQETIIVLVLMPACAFLWPAIYAWIWSRRVSRLAGR